MSKILRAVLAVLFFLGLGRQAAAQPSQLEEARHQIALGRYRVAEEAARLALEQPTREAMQAGVRQQWRLLLAEVYYHSRQYDQALEQLQAARHWLDDRRRRQPEDAFTGARLQIDRWQALVELARAAAGAPPPSGVVVDDIPAEGLSPPEQADRLELLVLRTQLVDLGEGNVTPPDRKRRWAPLRRLAAALLEQTRARGETAETQASILISLARCWEGEGNPEQAVNVLCPVAIPPLGATVNPRVEELRAEAARILRRAKLFAKEASFWHEVLAAPRPLTGEPDSVLADIKRLNVVAAIHFQWAETLHFAGAAASDVKQELDKSDASYRQALDCRRKLPADLQRKAELSAITTVSLQGLLRTRLAPQEWNKRLEYSLDKDDFHRAVELYDLLKVMRIESDPLVHHLEFTLGAGYLRVPDVGKAKESLAAAYAFFKTYPLTPPATRVQLLVLLAETDRLGSSEGRYEAAKSKLEEAAGCYAKAGLKDETLWQWIEVHRGRLAATCNRFFEAKERYDKVVRWAKVPGNEATNVGGMAQFGLAMLYKTFDKLDPAERICRYAIEHREPPTPGARDEQTLAPYHVALAGILILEGKLVLAQAEVNAAEQLSRNTVDTSLGCELRHLAAMLAFLRCKSEPPKDLAAADLAGDAEKSWLELQALYKDKGNRPGEARTCFYLSQVHFFRWQQQALRSVDTRREYETKIAEYRRRLRALDDEQSRYQEKYASWTQKTAAERHASFPDIKKPWETLEKKHKDLKQFAEDLHRRQVELAAAYEVVGSENVSAAAPPGAKGSPAAAATGLRRKDREPKELARAYEWVERAAELLKDSSLFNLRYLTLCHRAAVLHARAAWNPELKWDDEVRRCLEDAVALLERPRESLSESDVARAEFLSQYTQAFDQLIEWHCRHGNALRALAYAELCRNRSLLDSMRCSGDDGRQGQVPAERAPGQAGPGEVLDVKDIESKLQDRILRRDLVIYYHVGPSNSYLFVLGLDPGIQSIPLKTSTQPLSAQRIKVSVDKYLKLCSRPGEFPHALKSEETKARLAEITEQLLPAGIREKLAVAMERRKAPLIVSPAGALHQLPFEVLWVRDGGKQKFLIDDLPSSGIAYAPSLKILDTLEQAKPPPHDRPSLVTVACSAAAGYDKLPGASDESDAVARSFHKLDLPVLKLKDGEATKESFCRAIRRLKPTCVHLATHSDFSELTGALVFYPSRDAADEQAASLLTIGEIYDLRLDDCRLAVLSACQTNTGGEISREMPASISRAFLVARACRVVASQWPVDDKASCELMGHFLGEVAPRWKAGESCDYAAAMHVARQKLRSPGRSDWADDPFYWAPFVLIGPARDGTQAHHGLPINRASAQSAWSQLIPSPASVTINSRSSTPSKETDTCLAGCLPRITPLSKTFSPSATTWKTTVPPPSFSSSTPTSASSRR